MFDFTPIHRSFGKLDLSTIFQIRNRNFLFRSGFNATYSTADRDCGATLTANANEQTLTYSHTAEPGNTQIYRCSWFISASSNTKMVDVKTTAMDMPGWLINNLLIISKRKKLLG